MFQRELILGIEGETLYKLGQIVSTGISCLFSGDKPLPFKVLLSLFVSLPVYLLCYRLVELKWGQLVKEDCGLQNPQVSITKPNIKE